MADQCQHMNFGANVSVGRITKSEGAPVDYFTADVRIKCADCGLPFQFLGLEAGMDTQGARVSVDGLEARLAVCPQGAELSPFDRVIVRIGGVGPRHG